MSSQFFVKFQYQDKIKKIGLFPSDLTWDYITNIISRSFSISPSRIRLTYKDPEGDEITACCDQDLLEAYRASPNQQMLRFFIYKASLNAQNSMPIHESASKSSMRDDVMSNSSSKKSKSLSSIKDSPDPSEKKESIIVSQDSRPSSQELKLSSQEIRDFLKTLFQTSEAKKAVQNLKMTHNLGSSSSIPTHALLEDKNLLEQIFCESLTTAINEPTVPEEFIIQKNIPEVVVNPTEIDFKSTIISRGSDEEEKELPAEPARHKLDFEKSLLDSTLKETIYERSQGETLLRRTLDKNQASMRTKSLSSSICCKDLTSSYGVKLALQYENGKMRLLSIPSGEYTIIDSIGANKGENGNAASQIKKSYTVDVLPRLT